MTSPLLASVPDDPRLATVALLLSKLAQDEKTLVKVDRYYTGDQPLSFLAPEVEAQVGDRLASLVINWPRTIVDSVHRRLRVEGFRLGEDREAAADLMDLWNGSRMSRGHQLLNKDALVHARGFLSVWANPRNEQYPRIAVESAHQVAVAYEPGDADVVASAIKTWVDGDKRFVTLYLPDEIVKYRTDYRAGVEVALAATPRWEQYDRLANPLGVVPIVPLVNRPRTLNQDGESELTDVIPLADAVNKLATDMLVASEFHAMPRRWATGIQIPTDTARTQEQAAQYWDRATAGKTWLAGTGVTFGQFSEASLENFTNAIQMLTAQIAAVAGLPPHFLGINTANPASADAIRSAESTLVERAKEKQADWSLAYERAMQLAVAVRDGRPFAEVEDEYAALEVIWREPGTRTIAQEMDAAVKAVQAGIYDPEQARESVGLTVGQRLAIAERERTAADTAATASARAQINLAKELQQTEGLSQNAALAAAGLTIAASTNSAERGA